MRDRKCNHERAEQRIHLAGSVLRGLTFQTMAIWDPHQDDEGFNDELECEDFREHWYDQMVD
jgi:hypothetical protein